MVPKVNAIIVGAQKSGTSALAHFLSQHPDICVPPSKECHHFDAPCPETYFESERSEVDYFSQFPNYSGESILLDATPSYMYYPPVARRIYSYNPHVKLIFCLRDPVGRALSHYHMDVNRGWETMPLPFALLAEPIRVYFQKKKNFGANHARRFCYSYVSRGLYSRQIQRFLKLFPREHCFFVLTEDLLNCHDAALRHIYQFLGVKVPGRLPPQETIFEGTYVRDANRAVRAFLRLRFYREMRLLGAFQRIC